MSKKRSRNRSRNGSRNGTGKRLDYIERVAEAAKEADERLEEPEDTAPWDTARVALAETQELNFPPEIFAQLDEKAMTGRGFERIDEPEYDEDGWRMSDEEARQSDLADEAQDSAKKAFRAATGSDRTRGTEDAVDTDEDAAAETSDESGSAGDVHNEAQDAGEGADEVSPAGNESDDTELDHGKSKASAGKKRYADKVAEAMDDGEDDDAGSDRIEPVLKRHNSKLQADPEDTPEVRREIRRRRRVRNQIIAYASMAVVLMLLAVAIAFGVRTITKVIKASHAEKAAEEAAEAAAAGKQEEIVIQAPESMEPETGQEEAAEEVPELTEEDYLTEMVTSTISQMPIEDKVAQLFVITPEALTGVNAATRAGDGTREALAKYAVGGLVYDKKNVEDEDQFTELLDNTRNMSKYELFIGVREPGGEGSTIANALSDVPAVDSPADIAATGDASNAHNAGVTISSYLSFFGINVDLAPNGSVTADDKSVSARDSYGSDEAVAYEMISRMIEGLQTGSVNACMTDFPGTGEVTEGTDKGRVESELSADDLSARVVPYITGIAAGAGIIQTNNVTYVTVDEDAYPASLSKYVIGTMLRGKMGYDGVVMTGPLNETAVTDYFASDEAALYAYAAGADVLYMPEDFELAYQAILSAVQDGTIPESRVDQSLERIYKIKMAGYLE